jgi:transglutaminase-like putative cysteine protease
MPRVRIVHTTEYRYARPVRFTPHRLMTRPRDSHDLTVNDATLTFLPAPAATRWAHDVFGNSIAHVDFGEAESDILSIVSTLDLDHFPAPRSIELEPGTESFPLSYDANEFPDLARLLERHHPDPERKVDAWARTFLSDRGPTRTMDLLVAMTHAIKADFAYAARDTEGTNTPLQTLESRSGACRDFALLMMEGARSLGLAARFVSGYLYNPASGEQMTGGGATHAWCEVYLPGAGWIEFDPTNGLVAGENLIRVCVARTPDQAVPIGGGFVGAAGDFQSLMVDVSVAVTARADEQAQAADAASPEESVQPAAA